MRTGLMIAAMVQVLAITAGIDAHPTAARETQKPAYPDDTFHAERRMRLAQN